MNNLREIQGTIAAGFEAVKREFAAVSNAEGEKLSAQLAVYRHGTCVVDLWTGPDMKGDSLLGVYSASKGAAHIVVAMLVQDGTLRFDEKVSHYWPEFGVAGKQDITLRMLLAHRAGLVGPDQGMTLDDLADDRIVAERLGRQRPYWRPDTAFGYHALVIAALTGEVVFRATGRSVQDLFAEHVRAAKDIDVYLGLPKVEERRFLSAQPPITTPERLAVLAQGARSPEGLTGIAFNRHHPSNPPVWELPNFPSVRQLGPASFGGVASARGLARMYAATIGSLDGSKLLLTSDMVSEISQIHSIGRDLVTRDHKAFGAGFHLPSEYYPDVAQGAFGHSGAGGQQAFADPRTGIAYAYNRRRSPFPGGAAPENGRLIKAVYAAFKAKGMKHTEADTQESL